ncbi:MAG TPA: glycoside hydrolase family 43 protein [Flavihumibacter sp.]|nr:glycoside hydrolase family 43 protein [Flavihumibacter sp.]HPZ87575.1 glycoside hydrolase family 43 protein [Flavihumibacter sp.]HQD08074.1 glycoside hydrolase family 43 protein [Flavihumibacter sp.]
MNRKWLIVLGLVVAGCSTAQPRKTFTNPLLPTGPDPYSFYKDGYYYYTSSSGNRLVLTKTKNITDLKTAEKKIIYTPPEGTMWSKELWAPEVMFMQGKWYAYFAADDGDNNHHRMYVAENANADPMQGEWVLKGQIHDPSNKWAIDGDVFEYQGKLYMAWSGWEGDKNGQQDIYIAAMKNPYSIEGNRVRISFPQYDWETHGDLGAQSNPPQVNVNEGPQFLQHNKDLFIVFSASGCWTDFYALGLLRLTGTDPLNAKHWTKHPQPVFKGSVANGVYSPGHNSFFKSPDGKEDWILYHANSNPGDGCGNKRSPRAQLFTWNADGTPNFGEPVKEGQALALPSGSK